MVNIDRQRSCISESPDFLKSWVPGVWRKPQTWLLSLLTKPWLFLLRLVGWELVVIRKSLQFSRSSSSSHLNKDREPAEPALPPPLCCLLALQLIIKGATELITSLVDTPPPPGSCSYIVCI